MLINALRRHLSEFGVVARQGPVGVQRALEALRPDNETLPEWARRALFGVADQLEGVDAQIDRLETLILTWHRENAACRRLATIPGIGPVTASASAASAPHPALFRSVRHLAAWLGLTPRAHPSGGKERKAGISSMGDG